MRKLAAALVILAGFAPWLRAEEPEVQHQPVPCTVPDQVIRLCAEISDDNEVSKARIYFRVAGGRRRNGAGRLGRIRRGELTRTGGRWTRSCAIDPT